MNTKSIRAEALEMGFTEEAAAVIARACPFLLPHSSGRKWTRSGAIRPSDGRKQVSRGTFRPSRGRFSGS
jgi:hypothetical protein